MIMITFDKIVENKEYRERVIKFFRLPIRLSVSKEKFLSDLEFIKQTNKEWYDTIINYTEHDFNKLAKEQDTDKPDFTMENILEPLIEDIRNSEGWREFIEGEIPDVLENYDGITNTHGFYKKANDGKHFISIDLKSANWQSLQDIVGIKESYEDLIVKYTDNLIPPISKTFRTKITGVLGAKQIMLYNKKLLHDNKYNIIKTIKGNTGIDLTNEKPFAFYADEFLIEIDKETLENFNKIDIKVLEEDVYKETGIQVHITPFTLKWLGINKSCAKIYKDGFEILNISKDILLIINKLLAGIEIKDVDFEGIKLKNETKEEFIEKVKVALKLVE